MTLSQTGSNANGVTKSFNVVAGTNGSNIQLLSPAQMTGKYTLFTVARYSGANKQRIFQGTPGTGNYLSGFWNGGAGVFSAKVGIPDRPHLQMSMSITGY